MQELFKFFSSFPNSLLAVQGTFITVQSCFRERDSLKTLLCHEELNKAVHVRGLPLKLVKDNIE